MKTEDQLRAEFLLEVKKMSSKVDLSLAIIREQILELEIAKSELHLKILKP